MHTFFIEGEVMLVTQELAKEDLAQYLSSLHNVIQDALTRYEKEVLPEHKAIFNTTTKANQINDFMKFGAEQLALDHGFSTVTINRMFMLVIPVSGGRYAIRFKKLDEIGISKNIPTQQSKDFIAQVSFDNIERTYNLIAGYAVDANDQVIGIFLTCPNGNEIFWMMGLENTADTTKHQDMFISDNSKLVERKRDKKEGIRENESTGA